MSAASPSEFLTFYRRLATSQSLRRGVVLRPQVARPFHATASARSTIDEKDQKHATRKEDNLDVQSREAKHGSQSRSSDTGGAATREKDERSSAAKTKKEFPESPDPAIGMQDERGGKSH
ncbi:hypothetical protein AMS68_001149 [Peltaster fructicola]|uniref:Uncharacterized protein n=1 Tax=Peltaster fructicola TaxID=286661 RepID=A0A6H0XLK5_9PEZI|nr:hypothetical protein AMS68_001149 [Peltaster fructicola]